MSIADVAALLATEPRLAEHARADWIELIEADAMPATFNTIVALGCAFHFDLWQLESLAAAAIRAGDPVTAHVDAIHAAAAGQAGRSAA